jgi:hypothetical protein
MKSDGNKSSTTNAVLEPAEVLRVLEQFRLLRLIVRLRCTFVVEPCLVCRSGLVSPKKALANPDCR